MRRREQRPGLAGAFGLAAMVLTTAAAPRAAAAAAAAAAEGTAVWDFVVVGAGTGGSLAAARLAETGAEVLLLEAGPWDQPWIYDVPSRDRTGEETTWMYPTRFPEHLTMQNSKEFRLKVAAGRLPGGSSAVHSDVYNRPALREFEYLGVKSWSEAKVRAAFDRIERDIDLTWDGARSLDDIPDSHLQVIEAFVRALRVDFGVPTYRTWDGRHLPWRGTSGISPGWWLFRSCRQEPNGSHGVNICRRHTSYSHLVAARNATAAAAEARTPAQPATTERATGPASYSRQALAYIGGFAAEDSQPRSVEASRARCDELGPACGGFTCDAAEASCTVRAGEALEGSPAGEVSYRKEAARTPGPAKAESPAPGPRRGSVTTVTGALVARVLFEGREAVAVEVLRRGRRHVALARRAVVLAAGAIGTPKILTLSGVGDPLELQRLGVPAVLANREVGQGLADHLATYFVFTMAGSTATLDRSGPECGSGERFNVFFNLTDGPNDGDGRVDAEVRAFTSCVHEGEHPALKFFIEVVLLHPESRGKVVTASTDPEVMPTVEFPPLWSHDFQQMKTLLHRVWIALGLMGASQATERDVTAEEYARKGSYLYQHLCCSARVAPDGEPGVCDEQLRVRGAGGLYVADASALPATPSCHTSSTALLVAEFASTHAATQRPRSLPPWATPREELLSDAALAAEKQLKIPVVQLPDQFGNIAAGAGNAGVLALPLAGLGTGTIPTQKVADAVSTFLRLGGQHLDLATMYENYAEVRAGVAAAGIAGSRTPPVITWKVMPLGRDHVRAAVESALRGLEVPHLDIAMLHWPGDVSSGKLLRGAPLPTCAERQGGGTSWMRCRVESYAALLEERATGHVRAVGVSNFAPRHLDDLALAGQPAPTAHQLELHPLWHNAELLERSRRDGTAVMAYGCLGGKHAGAPMLGQVGFQKIARRRELTTAQVVLRWAVQQGAAIITGGSSKEHVEQNLRVFEFELDADEMSFMNSNPAELMEKSYGPHPEEIL